jgi:hypothetical protein
VLFVLRHVLGFNRNELALRDLSIALEDASGDWKLAGLKPVLRREE